jgi:hypothetical protein
MSSASSASSPSSLGQPIFEKLTRDNFILWKAQVVLIVRGVQLFGYLDGTVVELACTDSTHAAWVAQDQQVLRFINVSLSREVLGHVATCTTSAAVWKEIANMFASQSHARTIQLQSRLTMTRKGEQSVAAYYNKMKDFVDEMAGLDQDYNSFV